MHPLSWTEQPHSSHRTLHHTRSGTLHLVLEVALSSIRCDASHSDVRRVRCSRLPRRKRFNLWKAGQSHFGTSEFFGGMMEVQKEDTGHCGNDKNLPVVGICYRRHGQRPGSESTEVAGAWDRVSCYLACLRALSLCTPIIRGNWSHR